MHGETFFYSGHAPAEALGLLVAAGFAVEHREKPAAGGEPSFVALSPDGKLLAAGNGGGVTLWEPPTGREVRTLDVPAEDRPPAKGSPPPGPAAFSPDGKLLAVALGGGRVRVWDAASGKVVAVVGPAGGAPGPVAFTTGGEIITGGAGGARVWDVLSGKELRVVAAGDGEAAAAVSADGRVMLTTGTRSDSLTGRPHRVGPLRLRDLGTGKELRTVEAENPVLAVALSPDGKTLAYTQLRTLHLVDATTGKELGRAEGPDNFAHRLAFSADGKTLASAGYGAVRLWDAGTGRPLPRPAGHESAAYEVAFSRDGRRAVTTCLEDGTARVWDPATGKLVLALDGRPYEFGRAAFGPGGETVLTTGPNRLRLWEAATGRTVREFVVDPRAAGGADPKARLEGPRVLGAAVSRDGSRVTAVCLDWPASPPDEGLTVVAWEAGTGKELYRRKDRLRRDGWLSPSVALSPDELCTRSPFCPKSLRAAQKVCL